MKPVTVNVAFVLFGIPLVALPCDPIGSGGAPVWVSTETAIIVWNSKDRVEHFIRAANFVSYGRDLGYLVPSPSIPDLAEGKNEAFTKLLA